MFKMMLRRHILITYNMDSKLHYPESDLPIKWVAGAVAHFKCKSTDEYVSVLRKEIRYDKRCVCNMTPYGIIFVQLERALGKHSSDTEKRFAARCILRDIACYNEDVWGWIDDPVILRMINGISVCRYERIFIEMLEFNPLIIVGKGIIHAVLRYGTYGMMEAILDLCEEKLVIIDSENLDLEIPNNVIPIVCNSPNSMSSDAMDFLIKKHPMILTMRAEEPCSVIGLKIKDVIFLKYGSSMDEVLNARKKDTMWDRENREIEHRCSIL